jgi:hypothetical protein
MATKITTVLAAALAVGALTNTANHEAFARSACGFDSAFGYGRGSGINGGDPYVCNHYGYGRRLGFYGSSPYFYGGLSAIYDREACKYTVYWCE